MAKDVEFAYGEPSTFPYTPVADNVPGKVLVIGVTPMIVLDFHVTGRKATLSPGGGIWRCTAAGVYGSGVKVWWDDTAKKVTTTATSNPHFGVTLEASGADGDVILVRHNPNYSVAG